MSLIEEHQDALCRMIRETLATCPETEGDVRAMLDTVAEQLNAQARLIELECAKGRVTYDDAMRIAKRAQRQTHAVIEAIEYAESKGEPAWRRMSLKLRTDVHHALKQERSARLRSTTLVGSVKGRRDLYERDPLSGD